MQNSGVVGLRLLFRQPPTLDLGYEPIQVHFFFQLQQLQEDLLRPRIPSKEITVIGKSGPVNQLAAWATRENTLYETPVMTDRSLILEIENQKKRYAFRTSLQRIWRIAKDAA